MGKESKTVKNIMESIVPITRFNRGEASKIFDEVNESSVKVVLKNNSPACVLIKPCYYEAIIEVLEEHNLYNEVEKYMKDNECESGFGERLT